MRSIHPHCHCLHTNTWTYMNQRVVCHTAMAAHCHRINEWYMHMTGSASSLVSEFCSNASQHIACETAAYVELLRAPTSPQCPPSTLSARALSPRPMLCACHQSCLRPLARLLTECAHPCFCLLLRHTHVCSGESGVSGQD